MRIEPLPPEQDPERNWRRVSAGALILFAVLLTRMILSINGINL